MTANRQRNFGDEIDSMRRAIYSLLDRVGALESDLQELRDAAAANPGDDDQTALVNVVRQAADASRFMATH